MTAVLLVALAAPGPPAALLDMPFDDVSGLVCFEVELPGSPPLSALLDTGFDVSVLDTAAATRLGLRPREVRKEAAPGGTIEAGRLSPMTLRIGGLAIENVALTTIAVEGLSPLLGRPLDLIVGHDVLARYVVDIDWPRRRLRFYEPGSFVHNGKGVVIGAAIRDAQVFVPAGIGTEEGREVFGDFKLDTGSFDAAGLNLNFVRDQALVGTATREIPVGGIAVGGGTEGRLLRAQSLWLGSRRIERPLISYTVDSKGFENRADAGTIGVAALARFRLILDYPRRRVILEEAGPGPLHASEDLSGALLVSPAPGYRRVSVAQVVPGSAAAEAGLQAGDEITAVGGRAVTLAEARRLMEQPGPVSLSLRREGSTRTVTLVRRPILP